MKKKLRILCIDDDQDLSAMLDLYEKNLGAIDLTPESGLDKALRQIAKDHPDIVVIDLSVPTSDPLETIRGIGKNFPKIRIILFSGEDDQELIDKALAAGASKHVHKDQGVKKLLDAIYEVTAKA